MTVKRKSLEVVERRMTILKRWGIPVEGGGFCWKYRGETILEVQFWREGNGCTLQTRWFAYELRWGVLGTGKRSRAKIKKVRKEISNILCDLMRDIVVEEFHRQYGIGKLYKTGRLSLGELVLSFELSPEDLLWQFVLKGKEFRKVIAEGKQTQSPLVAFPQVAMAYALEVL